MPRISWTPSSDESLHTDPFTVTCLLPFSSARPSAVLLEMHLDDHWSKGVPVSDWNPLNYLISMTPDV